MQRPCPAPSARPRPQASGGGGGWAGGVIFTMAGFVPPRLLAEAEPGSAHGRGAGAARPGCFSWMWIQNWDDTGSGWATRILILGERGCVSLAARRPPARRPCAIGRARQRRRGDGRGGRLPGGGGRPRARSPCAARPRPHSHRQTTFRSSRRRTASGAAASAGSRCIPGYSSPGTVPGTSGMRGTVGCSRGWRSC